MKFLIFFFLVSCVSNKDNKVTLDYFRIGEKKNVLNIKEDKDIASEKIIKNVPKSENLHFSQEWLHEDYNSNNFYPHFNYKFQIEDFFIKNIGSGKERFVNTILYKENFLYFSDVKGTIYKFNLLEKNIAWEKNFYEKNDKNFSKNIKLVLSQNNLIVSDSIGTIYNIDIINGDLLWKKNFGPGFISNLNFYNEVIYSINDAGRLYAIDINDGQKLWSFDTLSQIIKSKSSSKISISENILVISTETGELVAFDLIKKQVLWSRNIVFSNVINFNDALKFSNILISNNRIYLSSNNSPLLVLNLKDGTLIKSFDILSNNNLVLIDNFLFVLSNSLYLNALDLNENKILWSKKIKNSDQKNINYDGILISLNNIYLISSNGYLSVFSAEDGEEIKKKKITTSLFASVIIAEKNLVFWNNAEQLIIIN